MAIPDYSAASRTLQSSGAQIVVPAGTIDVDLDEFTLPLSHYLWILRRRIWLVLSFIGAVMFATTIITMRMPKIYESTATLYVDRQEAKGIVGQESQIASGGYGDAETALVSQIDLLQSDSVVRPVAEKYGLLERERQFEAAEDAPLAKGAPIVLRQLQVTRRPNTNLLKVSYRSTDRQLAADVANGVANSYIEHIYNIRIRSSISLSRFMDRQIDELRIKMEGSAARLAQLERELNVINPEEKTNILSARLLQLNTEYTKAQSDRVRSEAAYRSAQAGTVEAAQVTGQGEALKGLSERLNDARERFAAIRTEYGVSHPEFVKAQATVRELQSQIDTARQNIIRRVEIEYQQALNREEMLAKSVGETKAEWDRLNLRSFEYQRAKREADADKNLFDELVRKIREAGINAGFQNNSVRIADTARPAWRPVSPQMWRNLLLALVLSSLLAAGTAILADSLDTTVRDPDQAARMLRTHIIGTLPSVKHPQELSTRAIFTNAQNSAGAESSERQLSLYEEAIRTIRSSVLLTDFDRRLKTLLLTSATASEGKSTAASHLTFVHADQNQRTLLVDCDLRRPSQHRIHNVPLASGLANVLTGESTWQSVVHRPFNNPRMGLITAGQSNRRAADLLGTALPPLIEEMSAEYDLIVLDAPPLLGFAESLQMAALADGVVLVARAGTTNRKAVAAAVSTLSHLRANLIGLVLNQVKRSHSDHYYYYGYYSKYQNRYREAGAGGA